MLLQIADVLYAQQLSAMVASLQSNDATFEDGKKTAGWQAREVKNNLQATSASAASATALVKEQLLHHPVFKAAAIPKTFVKLMVSRYLPGMEYGTHVDDALMAGVRTDLSFTLFLRDPETYAGGELVIEGNDGDTAIKLPAGSLILYPTTSLHRVAPVTEGERLAIVGWVRSYIRSAENRETLFDLENAIASLRSTETSRAVLNGLLKVKANLLRQWAED